jgi:hypothetical protein
MANLKKVLALSLVLMFVVALVPAFGAGARLSTFPDNANVSANHTDAVDFITTLGILQGDGQGNLNPTANVTRAEMATIIFRMANGTDADASATSTWVRWTPFTDIAGSWHQGSIAWAYQTGVINGTSPTTFNPNGNVTFEQAVAMILRAMNINVSGVGFAQNVAVLVNQMALNHRLNMAPQAPLQRQQVAQLIDNIFFVPADRLPANSPGQARVQSLPNLMSLEVISGTLVSNEYASVLDNRAIQPRGQSVIINPRESGINPGIGNVGTWQGTSTTAVLFGETVEAARLPATSSLWHLGADITAIVRLDHNMRLVGQATNIADVIDIRLTPGMNEFVVNARVQTAVAEVGWRADGVNSVRRQFLNYGEAISSTLTVGTLEYVIAAVLTQTNVPSVIGRSGSPEPGDWDYSTDEWPALFQSLIDDLMDILPNTGVASKFATIQSHVTDLTLRLAAPINTTALLGAFTARWRAFQTDLNEYVIPMGLKRYELVNQRLGDFTIFVRNRNNPIGAFDFAFQVANRVYGEAVVTPVGTSMMSAGIPINTAIRNIGGLTDQGNAIANGAPIITFEFASDSRTNYRYYATLPEVHTGRITGADGTNALAQVNIDNVSSFIRLSNILNNNGTGTGVVEAEAGGGFGGINADLFSSTHDASDDPVSVTRMARFQTDLWQLIGAGQNFNLVTENMPHSNERFLVGHTGARIVTANYFVLSNVVDAHHNAHFDLPQGWFQLSNGDRGWMDINTVAFSLAGGARTTLDTDPARAGGVSDVRLIAWNNILGIQTPYNTGNNADGSAQAVTPMNPTGRNNSMPGNWVFGTYTVAGSGALNLTVLYMSDNSVAEPFVPNAPSAGQVVTPSGRDIILAGRKANNNVLGGASGSNQFVEPLNRYRTGDHWVTRENTSMSIGMTENTAFFVREGTAFNHWQLRTVPYTYSNDPNTMSAGIGHIMSNTTLAAAFTRLDVGAAADVFRGMVTGRNVGLNTANSNWHGVINFRAIDGTQSVLNMVDGRRFASERMLAATETGLTGPGIGLNIRNGDFFRYTLNAAGRMVPIREVLWQPTELVSGSRNAGNRAGFVFGSDTELATVFNGNVENSGNGVPGNIRWPNHAAANVLATDDRTQRFYAGYVVDYRTVTFGDGIVRRQIGYAISRDAFLNGDVFYITVPADTVVLWVDSSWNITEFAASEEVLRAIFNMNNVPGLNAPATHYHVVLNFSTHADDAFAAPGNVRGLAIYAFEARQAIPSGGAVWADDPTD